MARYQRYHQWRKGEQQHIDDDLESAVLTLEYGSYKRTMTRLFSLLFLSLIFCCFVLAPQLFCLSSSFNILSPSEADNGELGNMDVMAPLCSSISNGSICCDRTSIRSDVCVMKGDVRTHSASSSVFVYSSKDSNGIITNILGGDEGGEDDEFQHEKIRPYTRKWETSVMESIDELDLVSKKANFGVNHGCDVWHDVPAVFFSTGGYTGNVYHEFNDGIMPLYITSQHYNKKVVFVILEYHDWWVMKYEDVLSQLSDYPAIDFSGDKRTHCFPEAIVGLRIHDELTVDSSLLEGNRSIVDFRNVLDRAYSPRIQDLIKEEEREELETLRERFPLSPSSDTLLKFKRAIRGLKKPRLLIVSRNGSRAILNENAVVNLAKRIGFEVQILRPERTTELARIYRALNDSDVMVGVHGAAMTHFLFMKPGSVFIQVVPLGTEWAADAYYGEPAVKLGLKYISYRILPKESSLYDEYDKADPVLIDPKSINEKGWEYTKRIYLDGQDVRLYLRRFGKRLARAYVYSASKLKNNFDHQTH